MRSAILERLNPAAAASAAVAGSVLLLGLACDAPQREREAPTATSWPQWRGPDADGTTTLDRLPVEWSPDSDNIRWRVELPVRGAAQPIAAAGRIFLSGSRGGDEPIVRSVIAIDAVDGSVEWEAVVFEGPTENKHHRFGSFATPTPVTDGETVWAFFGGYVAAVSVDGELLWRREVDPGYWRSSRYGAASSPLLVGNAVVVFGDDEFGKADGVSWLAAFQRDSGEPLWRAEWEDTCCSYATPVLRRVEGGVEIVIATSPWLLGFDPVTGERLWQFELPMVQVVPTPVIRGDLVIQGGSIHDRRIVAWRLSGTGSATTAEKLWEEKRAAPEMSSPILYQRLFYTVSDTGVATCFEPETGEVLWRRRLPGSSYRSAIVGGDGQLYLTTLGGATTVIEAARKFRLLANNESDEVTESSLAVAGECLLLRTRRHLTCIARQPLTNVANRS